MGTELLYAVPTAGAGGPFYRGEIVRVLSDNVVVKAQADTLGNTLGLWGIVDSGVVATGGVVNVLTASANGRVLLETGLTPAAGDPLYISDTVAGRATNIAPSLAIQVGSIVDASMYTLYGYVEAVTGSGGGSSSGIGPQGAQGNGGPAGAVGPAGGTGPSGGTGPQGSPGSAGATGAQGSQGAGFQGAQGAQGADGVQGAQGTQGAGFQGASGSQGFQGSGGVQGSQGASGSGSQGATGAQGFQGANGVQGNQGATGTGAQGAQGGSGAQGFQGSGAQGAQGTAGSQGFQGGSGAQGPTGGAQGAQGASGVQGSQGNQGAGTAGTQGPAGPQGSSGGAQGAQGGNGAQGATGAAGATGATGSQGAQGGLGAQGATGATGATGTTGSQGAQGATGTTGAQGFQGGLGAQGAAGAQGATGTQGFQGAQGRQGNTGTTGTTGTTGAQGAQGGLGAQGNTGNTGATGATGGTGGTGAQGAQGFTGTAGSTGTTGAQGAQGFQGAQGRQGATGAQGFQGNTGVTGAQGFQGNAASQNLNQTYVVGSTSANQTITLLDADGGRVIIDGTAGGFTGDATGAFEIKGVLVLNNAVSNVSILLNGSTDQGISKTGGTGNLVINTDAPSIAIQSAANGSGILFSTTAYFDFASTSPRTQQNGTVMNHHITPATRAASASLVLDAYNWEALTVTFTGSTGITTSTGVNMFNIERPTYTDASALTITNAATFVIKGAPIAGGSVTLTNPYALWIQQGATRHDGNVVPGTTGTYTLGDSTHFWLSASAITTNSTTVQGDVGGAANLTLTNSSAQDTYIFLQNTNITTKGSIAPVTSGTYTLGSTTKAWNVVYTQLVQNLSGSDLSVQGTSGTGAGGLLTLQGVNTTSTQRMVFDPVNNNVSLRSSGGVGNTSNFILFADGTTVDMRGGKGVMFIGIANTATTGTISNTSGVLLYCDPSSGSLIAKTLSGTTTVAA